MTTPLPRTFSPSMYPKLLLSACNVLDKLKPSPLKPFQLLTITRDLNTYIHTMGEDELLLNGKRRKH